MSDVILLDDDISDERSRVRIGGREWLFDYSLGSLSWYRRYLKFMEASGGVVKIGGDDENTEEFYDLAAEVLCPANGTREALGKVRPGPLLNVARLFATAWFAGTEVLERIAANQAPNVTEMQQPAPERMTDSEERPVRKRRSA